MDKSDAIATGLDDRGSGIDFRHGLNIFLCSIEFRPSSGAHPAVGTGSSYPGTQSVRGVKLTARLHIVPKLFLYFIKLVI
jgi:hypothetical protein